jgi:hypothetical protein
VTQPQPGDTWCNCQAIPGTPNYPGPWHEKGGEKHYPCYRNQPQPGQRVTATIIDGRPVSGRYDIVRDMAVVEGYVVHPETVEIIPPTAYEQAAERAHALLVWREKNGVPDDVGMVAQANREASPPFSGADLRILLVGPGGESR